MQYAFQERRQSKHKTTLKLPKLTLATKEITWLTGIKLHQYEGNKIVKVKLKYMHLEHIR